MPERINIDYNSLRLLVMQAPVSFLLLCGKEFVIKLVNQRAMDYTGKSHEELIDKPFFVAFPEFMERNYRPVLENIMKTGETFRAQEVPINLLNWHSEESKYVNLVLKPLTNKAGKAIGIIGVASDVTELVRSRNDAAESDEKFRAIFDSMDQGLAIVDVLFDEDNNAVDYLFHQVNATFEDEAGLKDVVGRRASEVLKEHAAYWVEIFGNVLKTGEPVRLSANRTVTGRWYETNIFRIGGKGSRRIAFLFTDITPRKEEEMHKQRFADELKEQVEARTSELNISNRELLQFARAASHDLKEPVRKIRTFSNFILSDYQDQLPERVSLFLNKILKATARLHRMIESMRSYISLEKPAEKFVPVDLNEVVTNVITGFEIMIENKNALFTINPLPRVEGSPLMLHQLFQNLIQNSLKFTLPGKNVSIFIGAREIRLNGRDFTEIEINDTGIGFPPEYSHKIFESFVRLNPAEAYEGEGMGLALCKKIVEKHQGRITATGEEGKGASFKLLLPLKQFPETIN